MMGSRAWQATVHRVAKHQMSEATEHTCIWSVDPGTSVPQAVGPEGLRILTYLTAACLMH